MSALDDNAERITSVAASETVVVMDLQNVSFLDSSGVQRIVFAQQAACRSGGDAILRRQFHIVTRVLDTTGLRDAFTIDD